MPDMRSTPLLDTDLTFGLSSRSGSSSLSTESVVVDWRLFRLRIWTLPFPPPPNWTEATLEGLFPALTLTALRTLAFGSTPLPFPLPLPLPRPAGGGAATEAPVVLVAASSASSVRPRREAVSRSSFFEAFRLLLVAEVSSRARFLSAFAGAAAALFSA